MFLIELILEKNINGIELVLEVDVSIVGVLKNIVKKKNVKHINEKKHQLLLTPKINRDTQKTLSGI